MYIGEEASDEGISWMSRNKSLARWEGLVVPPPPPTPPKEQAENGLDRLPHAVHRTPHIVHIGHALAADDAVSAARIDVSMEAGPGPLLRRAIIGPAIRAKAP